MNFQLNFDTTGMYAVDLASFELGLETYNKAKESIPSLKLDDFTSSVKRHFVLGRNIHVVVPLEMAKKSGHFQKVPSITITIPENALNCFFRPVLEVWHWKKPGRRGINFYPRKTKIKIKYEDYQDGDEVLYVQSLNEAKLLEAWEKADFPLVWEPIADD